MSIATSVHARGLNWFLSPIADVANKAAPTVSPDEASEPLWGLGPSHSITLHQERFAGGATRTLVIAKLKAKICRFDTQQPHFAPALFAHGTFIAAKFVNGCTGVGHASLENTQLKLISI